MESNAQTNEGLKFWGVKQSKLQAHFINCRTMEVFRQIPSGQRPGNSLADDVRQASPPLDHWRKFVYCQSMTGRIFGDVDHFQVDSEITANKPSSLNSLQLVS